MVFQWNSLKTALKRSTTLGIDYLKDLHALGEPLPWGKLTSVLGQSMLPGPHIGVQIIYQPEIKLSMKAKA